MFLVCIIHANVALFMKISSNTFAMKICRKVNVTLILHRVSYQYSLVYIRRKNTVEGKIEFTAERYFKE